MQFKNYLKAQMPFLALIAMAFVLSSCGSSQYVGEENDGIYSSPKEYNENNVEVVQDIDANTTYYKNYFKEKSTEFDYIPTEDEVFTDVDSYEGKYAEQDSTAQESYAGWGQENSGVTINVYGGFNSGWGGYYNPYYAGWGWNYGWGWSYGWGWNTGFYNPYWCSPYGYGGYYGYPYYNGYYNNPYYGRNGVAYHNSRRGSSLNRMSTLGRRSNISGITRGNRASTRSGVSTQPRRGNSTVTSDSRPRSNTSTPRPRTNTYKPKKRTNTYTPRPRTSTYSSPRSNSYSSPRPSGNSSSPSRGGRR